MQPNTVPTSFSCLAGLSSILCEHNYSALLFTAEGHENQYPFNLSTVDRIPVCEESVPMDKPLTIFCTPDITYPGNSDAFIESDLIRNSDIIHDGVALKSSAQTQTAMQLSARSPRKEKLRAVLKCLRIENRKLKKRNEELEGKFKKLEEFMALGPYKSLLESAGPTKSRVWKISKLEKTKSNIGFKDII